MSFSLQIQNGDLALNGTSFGTVTNSAKLQQDLTCAILTPLGLYESHPDFGSILEDNLIDPGLSDIIGTKNFNQAATLIKSELTRICQNYQRQQINRNESDVLRFGKSTLTPGESLLSIVKISFLQAEDRLLCTLELEIGTDIIEMHIPLGE